MMVVIVGAGPGGLAVAAALGSAGVPATIVERATSVGSSWRGHYDRLHLHTARFLSGLPGMPIPRPAGGEELEGAGSSACGPSEMDGAGEDSISAEGGVLGVAAHGPSGCPPVPASAAARDRRCPPSLSGSVWQVAPLPKAIPAAPLAATRSGWSKK
jgi:hypothetical protein